MGADTPNLFLHLWPTSQCPRDLIGAPTAIGTCRANTHSLWRTTQPPVPDCRSARPQHWAMRATSASARRLTPELLLPSGLTRSLCRGRLVRIAFALIPHRPVRRIPVYRGAHRQGKSRHVQNHLSCAHSARIICCPKASVSTSVPTRQWVLKTRSRRLKRRRSRRWLGHKRHQMLDRN